MAAVGYLPAEAARLSAASFDGGEQQGEQQFRAEKGPLALETAISPDKEKSLTSRNIALGVAAVAATGGFGALIYANWENIKRFFKWGKLANEAAADSIFLLENKIDHAVALCVPQQDADVLKSAIDAAQNEARNLVAINKQLREKLKAALPVNASDREER